MLRTNGQLDGLAGLGRGVTGRHQFQGGAGIGQRDRQFGAALQNLVEAIELAGKTFRQRAVTVIVSSIYGIFFTLIHKVIFLL
jgi:hypothetical protein